MGLGGGLDSLMKKRGSEVVMTSHGLDLDLGTFVPGGVAGGFLGKLDFSRDRVPLLNTIYITALVCYPLEYYVYKQQN